MKILHDCSIKRNNLFDRFMNGEGSSNIKFLKIK